jgi:hypothetical protein
MINYQPILLAFNLNSTMTAILSVGAAIAVVLALVESLQIIYRFFKGA